MLTLPTNRYLKSNIPFSIFRFLSPFLLSFYMYLSCCLSACLSIRFIYFRRIRTFPTNPEEDLKDKTISIPFYRWLGLSVSVPKL